MNETYDSIINKFKNKKIVVYGLGRSNIPVIKALTDEKIEVLVYDEKPKESFPKEIVESLESNIYAHLHLSDESIWEIAPDIIIRTPGVSYFSKKIVDAKKYGSAVTSEMELFFDLCPCPIIGITGSDGKTTVSTLIFEMLKTQGIKVHLGGNIGTPLLPKINEIKQTDMVVAELSSFQLMSMRKSPDISVVTNISPNHLDIHKDMDEYILAKKQILMHQNGFSKAILNFENTEAYNMQEIVRGKCLFFSPSKYVPNGAWLNENGDIILSENGENEKIINKKEIKIPGNHNLENYLAAICAVKDLVSVANIRKVANSFSGVEHRIEFVRNVNGVDYYNDSIASSPSRTINGTLSLFDKKITLIAGGYDKNISFEELAKKIVEKVSVLVLLGATSEKIEKEILKLEYKNSLKILKVGSMQEAIVAAQSKSQIGDIVVLSPACASFDMYKDFEKRGNHFKKLVNEL